MAEGRPQCTAAQRHSHHVAAFSDGAIFEVKVLEKMGGAQGSA